MDSPHLIAIMGPTASGKSQVAEAIANQLNAAIINADAFQIYRGMDVGTGKSPNRARYQLLDIRNPNQDFGVGEFVVLAAGLLHEHFQNGKSVVICGGTGLYVRALVEQYDNLMPAPSLELRNQVSRLTFDEAVAQLQEKDSQSASTIDLKNEIRVKRALEKTLGGQSPVQFTIPPFQIQKVAIIPTPELSQQKIRQRTDEMIQNGWVSEVKDLLSKGYNGENPGFRALGYQAIAEYIEKGGNEEDLVNRIKVDTVQYAKRQRTWLRAEPNLIVYSETEDVLAATSHLH